MNFKLWISEMYGSLPQPHYFTAAKNIIDTTLDLLKSQDYVNISWKFPGEGPDYSLIVSKFGERMYVDGASHEKLKTYSTPLKTDGSVEADSADGVPYFSEKNIAKIIENGAKFKVE